MMILNKDNPLSLVDYFRKLKAANFTPEQAELLIEREEQLHTAEIIDKLDQINNKLEKIIEYLK